MARQTKNIITRELIKKELRFLATAQIRSFLFLSVGLSPFCILFALFFLFASRTIENLLFTLFTCIILSSPIWVSLWLAISALLERKAIDRGEFDVVTKPLYCKSEDLIYRHRHMHLEENLNFGGFEKISVNHTEFELASPGDDYYIVHYRNKNTIKLLYSSKRYEYREK